MKKFKSEVKNLAYKHLKIYFSHLWLIFIGCLDHTYSVLKYKQNLVNIS